MHAKYAATLYIHESTYMQMLQNLTGFFISKWNAKRTVHRIVARSMYAMYRIGMFRAAGVQYKDASLSCLTPTSRGAAIKGRARPGWLEKTV